MRSCLHVVRFVAKFLCFDLSSLLAVLLDSSLMTPITEDRHAVMNSTETGLAEAISKASPIARWHWLIALVSILVVELACFGPIFKKVGFYLDDWITLSLISFGPQSFFDSFHHYLVSDPRVIVRPVEALYYVLEFFMFGTEPLGYHLVNAGLEVVAAFLLYRPLSLDALSSTSYRRCAFACLFFVMKPFCLWQC
jgi:hypothetical protein